MLKYNTFANFSISGCIQTERTVNFGRAATLLSKSMGRRELTLHQASFHLASESRLVTRQFCGRQAKNLRSIVTHQVVTLELEN